MKWVQVNCRISDTTISRSGKTSANWIMRRRFFSANPRPNSSSNCLPNAETISAPYSARRSPRISRRMRSPRQSRGIIGEGKTRRPAYGSQERGERRWSMIRKLKSGEYRLYSRKKDAKTGKRKNLGTFATRAAAEQHEREVQFFKKA